MEAKMLVALLSLLVGACIAQPYFPDGTRDDRPETPYDKPPPSRRGFCYLKPDPYDPRAYIQKDAGGRPVRFYCSKGLVFKAKICACDYPVTPWAKRPAKGYDTPKTDDPYWEPSPYVQQTTYKPRTKGYDTPKTDDPYWEPSPYVQQTTYKPRTKGYDTPKTDDPYWEPSPYVQQTTYKPRTKGYYPRKPYQELPPYFPLKATGYATEYDGLYDPPRNKPVFRSPKRSGRSYWRSRRGRGRNRG